MKYLTQWLATSAFMCSVMLMCVSTALFLLLSNIIKVGLKLKLPGRLIQVQYGTSVGDKNLSHLEGTETDESPHVLTS